MAGKKILPAGVIWLLLIANTAAGQVPIGDTVKPDISIKGLPSKIISPKVIHANKDYNLLVLPVIARSIETSWSFGAAASLTFRLSKKDSADRTSNLQGLGLYSLKKQEIVALNGTVFFPGEQYIISYQASFSYFPDQFWGIGNQTPNSSQESYDFKQVYLFLHGQRALGSHLFAGLRYEYQRVLKVDFKPNGLLDKEAVPGRFGYQVSGLGASFTFDTRNHAFTPDKGEMLQVYASQFGPLIGSDFSYINYVVDLRKFWKTCHGQVLAVQAYGFYNAGDVPLRSLASFGGANSMRGYYSGRFRDKNQAFAQAEYRVPVYGRLGLVAFAGAGDVSRRFAEFYLNELKYSYGGGLRIMLSKKEKLNLRLDYGIGQHSSGFYFQLGEAF